MLKSLNKMLYVNDATLPPVFHAYMDKETVFSNYAKTFKKLAMFIHFNSNRYFICWSIDHVYIFKYTSMIIKLLEVSHVLFFQFLPSISQKKYKKNCLCLKCVQRFSNFHHSNIRIDSLRQV